MSYIWYSEKIINPLEPSNLLATVSIHKENIATGTKL